MSADLAGTIFQYFREEERDAYRGAIASLAAHRKLRPVFVTKKPVDQQFVWLKDACARKQSAGAAEHLLQVWLMRARSEMLVKFLDAAGISHDGEGAIDDLPETLEAEKVKAGVDALLADYPGEEVAVYLHVFQGQTNDGWPELATVLAEDERLKLGA
ncbi:hypothetical protein [Sulfuriroseicoccus oceanibius]|uniref:Uncharacterized protein n=1 Tax=Sulfuriroseicoccus oceanibius TaxID=2707525 RepID=A0A6B3LET5_9BACT|nr:hypothetical protein [Sulfuriroseicoccus oceanibius]QQL45186.1 hypothetical protein G3M56_000945 [Sulfuriroseicoccus oceanibius]